MSQFARKNTLIELVELHQLDQVCKPRVAIIQTVEHVAVIFHLQEEKQQAQKEGQNTQKDNQILRILCLFAQTHKLMKLKESEKNVPVWPLHLRDFTCI